MRLSASALERAATLASGAGASVRLLPASLLRLPYADATFAAVLAECVLSTTSKPEGLAELRRVTAPGGWLLVSDVTSSGRVSLPESLASVLCLAAALAPGELEVRLPAAGWEVVRAWDETAGVTSLIHRLEARIGLLATVARDIGATGPLLDLGLDARTFRDPARVAAVLAEIRELVASGRIGYRAVAVRARRGRDLTPAGAPGSS